jgi:proline dehydrogenase
LKQESLVERVIYRLIKKHISGQTMNSAIDRAKQFNSKGIPVSINFMAQAPGDTSKANYITATYMQLVREIARLGVTASVHLQLDQLGMSVSKEVAARNLQRILEVSERSGVFVWCELQNPNKDNMILTNLHDAKGLGLAFNSLEECLPYVKKRRSVKDLKVMCKSQKEVRRSKSKAHDKQEKLHYIEAIAQNSQNLVLLSPNEKDVSRLLKNNSRHRKSLVFEFQLGYGEKRINRMLKRGARISVYIPFGKDWINYAINNVPEGYMRTIAGSLLKEREEERVPR